MQFNECWVMFGCTHLSFVMCQSMHVFSVLDACLITQNKIGCDYTGTIVNNMCVQAKNMLSCLKMIWHLKTNTRYEHMRL